MEKKIKETTLNTQKGSARFFGLFLSVLFVLLFGVKIVDAATLYFSPSSGNFTEGNIFTVTLLANSEGQPINNAEAVISYPTDLLELTSLSKFGSIFSLWVLEPNFSNATGKISFNGGLQNPGFNGGSGKILTMVFKAKKPGQASLVSTEAAVRANDGYGTDVLKSNPQALFTIIAEETPAPPATEKPVIGLPKAPKISSDTHSDPEEWYAESDATFTWSIGDEITAVRLSVNESPTGVPTVLYDPPITSKTVNDLDDGVWYFHVQLQNDTGWGEVAHFKFQIDTEQPDQLDIELVSDDILIERKVDFTIEANDKLSGIDYYEIRVDDGEYETWVDDGEGIYTAPPVSPGKHTLTVKAFDKAGNFITDSIEFTVEQDPYCTCGFLGIDLVSVTISLLALIILLLLLLLYFWYKCRTMRDRLLKEVREAERSLHKAFDLLKEDTRVEVETLKKVRAKREFTKEEKRIIEQLEKNLDDAEKFISKEVDDIKKEIK